MFRSLSLVDAADDVREVLTFDAVFFFPARRFQQRNAGFEFFHAEYSLLPVFREESPKIFFTLSIIKLKWLSGHKRN